MLSAFRRKMLASSFQVLAVCYFLSIGCYFLSAVDSWPSADFQLSPIRCYLSVTQLAICCHQCNDNYWRWTTFCRLSPICLKLSFISYLLSAVCYLLSVLNYMLSAVSHLMSALDYLLSPVCCRPPVSRFVSCQLRHKITAHLFPF